MGFDVAAAKEAGYTDDEIASHLATERKFDLDGARKAGYTPQQIIEHLQADIDSFNAKPSGAGQRFVRGIGEAALGLGQIGVNTASNGNPTAEQVKTDFNQLVSDYVAESEAMAPEGLDVARFAGNAALTAPLGVGGAEAAVSRLGLQGIGRLAAGGAIAGGIGGASVPVTEGDFASTKAQQVGAGAAGGALLTPAAAKLFTVLGRAGGQALRTVAGKVQSGTPIAQIKIEITNALEAQGVDVSKLTRAYLDDIANQVKAAKDAGGTLDAETLANQAAAKTLNIDLTRGQATQNPSQYSRELFLREGPGGEELGQQYTGALTQLNRGITDLQAKLPKPTLNVDAGRKALDALKAADAPMKKKVDDLYAAARASAGIDTPLDGMNLAKSINDDLVRERVSKTLPGDYVSLLTDLGSGKNISIGTAAEEIQRINGLLKSYAGKPEGIALNIIKKRLDEAVNATGDAMGGATAQAFKNARTAAAVRFKRLEAIPSLQKAIDDDLPPDDFIKKVIYNAPRDELKKTRAYLRSNNRDAWNQLRSQVLEDIRLATTKGSDNLADFSQDAFNKRVNSLRDSGKLGLLFSESEIKQLKTIGHVARLVQKGPPGVSRTGLSGAAKATGMLVNLISKVGSRVPVVGPMAAGVADVAKRGGASLEATVSMQPAKVAFPGGLPPLPENLQRGLAYGGASLLVPASEQ